jgi:hypothetical protein
LCEKKEGLFLATEMLPDWLPASGSTLCLSPREVILVTEPAGESLYHFAQFCTDRSCALT